MQRTAVLALLVACASHKPPSWNEKQSFSFGPYTLQPTEEITDQCVQITLGNTEDIYISAVELNTGPGFHHSNWFYLPYHEFKGAHTTNDTDDAASAADDGTFKCTDRGFEIAIAGIFGNVLYAQSTQAPHEVQQFPPGAALRIPAHYKLVAQIHLLNGSDNVLSLSPSIALTPIPKAQVTTPLSAMSFENQSIGLPPNMQSQFTVDCDLMPEWQILYQQGQVTSPTPNFKIYYALAHYHAMGTGLTIDALQPDDTTTSNVFSTTSTIGDVLGKQLDPQFAMDGFTRLRFSCDYYNNTASTVVWGTGSNEMCVFLAFSDSPYKWGGGVEMTDAPGPGTLVNGVMTYTHACTVQARDASL
jgi:hypothetical protein